MDFNVSGHNMFFIVFIAFLVSAITVPFVKKVAFHVGALDIPNERKVHTKPMPRMGGLAIFAAFLVGYMLFGNQDRRMLSILIGGFLIVLLGIFDDIKPIRARVKFLFQIIAACIVVFYGRADIVLNEISFFGITIPFITPLNYIVTIIFIVSISNAINLVDGLDGLAAGISSIYFLTIAIIAYIMNMMQGLDIVITLIMLGGTLGFLLHNFNPAKIFMGDTGSLFLGFTISIIALLGYKGATLISLIIPILILAIPIFDTLLAIFRRLLKGENIGAPDKEHFHHQLLKMNFSVRTTVLIIYGINILFAAVSVFYAISYGTTIGNNIPAGKVAIALYVILMILMLFLVMKTDILFKHDKKEEKKKTKK